MWPCLSQNDLSTALNPVCKTPRRQSQHLLPMPSYLFTSDNDDDWMTSSSSKLYTTEPAAESVLKGKKKKTGKETKRQTIHRGFYPQPEDTCLFFYFALLPATQHIHQAAAGRAAATERQEKVGQQLVWGSFYLAWAWVDGWILYSPLVVVIICGSKHRRSRYIKAQSKFQGQSHSHEFFIVMISLALNWNRSSAYHNIKFKYFIYDGPILNLKKQSATPPGELSRRLSDN